MLYLSSYTIKAYRQDKRNTDEAITTSFDNYWQRSDPEPSIIDQKTTDAAKHQGN